MNMNDYDPELEFYISEMFGDQGSEEQLPSESLQKSTNAIDEFFQRSGRDGSVSCEAEPSALTDLREFVKREKQKVPDMTVRELRSSAVQVLRKAADALAAI